MKPIVAISVWFTLIAILSVVECMATPLLADSRIDAAAAYSQKCGGQAFIVMQGGHMRHESYANGGTAKQPFHVMSITKNLAVLAILAACSEKLLSLDEPVAGTITEWRSHPDKAHIRIRELLQQTSGLASGYETIYERGVRDKNQSAIALQSIASPGGKFDYAPGNYELLEEILRRKLITRGITPLAYLTAKILTPLGIRLSSDWRHDHEGNAFFSAGARFTARDLAKIGEFIRTRGHIWILPILPATVFDDIFTGSMANSMYGLGFWLNTNASQAGSEPISIEESLGSTRSPQEWRQSCLSNSAPSDLVAMVGSGGMRCYLVPSCKLVLVRFGQSSKFSDEEFLQKLFGHG